MGAQQEGGKARARKLSSEERKAIAASGAQARWAKADPERDKLPRAICGSHDRPLRIGDISIPCYVLDNETRVLTVGGLSDGLGMARGGSMVAGLNRLELFTRGGRISQFINNDLSERVHAPIVFITPTGAKAYGYDAEILVDLCEAVLAARQAGILQRQQLGIAERCEALMRGLARLGIIGLVDEATGYQYVRRHDDLHRLLEAYIARDLLPWAKRFPDEFYVEIFRLRGWELDPLATKKPQYVGKLTNLLIYDRLPLGVLDELRRKNPVQEDTRRRRYHHHRFLTEQIGHPHLDAQMKQVLAWMRVSDNWPEFMRLFRKGMDRVKPSKSREPAARVALPSDDGQLPLI